MKLDNRGLTLVEILIAMFVFTLALAALLSSIVAVLYLIDLSKDFTVAYSDIRNMMEDIRTTPFANMLSLFPDGLVDGPVSNRYSDLVGGYLLGNEHITVTYADVTSDPLEVKVILTWQDKHARTQTASASTFKAR
jgi:hypothetical protein